MGEQYVVQDGRVLMATISTAARGSSLSSDALVQITEAVAPLADDPGDVGAILLRGTGPNFCTGGDVGAFADAEDPGRYVRQLADTLHAMQLALRNATVPVIAAVHGWAAGAGMSVALAADLVVAGESTRFRAAYTGIGFSPDGGMSATLPRAVGEAHARRILLTDAVVPAAEALALGLVTTVVADADLHAEADALAARLAAGPTMAFGRIKRLLRTGATTSFVDQLDAEVAAISASADGAEGREGIEAFRERRAPRYR